MYGVENGAEYVHGALENDPAQAHAIFKVLVAVGPDAMDNGDDAGHTEADEHGGAVRTPGGGAEALNPGHSRAAYSKSTHLHLHVLVYER